MFNAGDYERAVFDKTTPSRSAKCSTQTICSSLGKELRLKQQYFFVACAIADLLRRHLDHAKNRHDPQAIRERLLMLPEKVAIQLRRHPSVDCDRRTSAAAHRQIRAAMGHRLAAYRKRVCVHQSRFLPEALEVWASSFSASFCRAICKSSTK